MLNIESIYVGDTVNVHATANSPWSHDFTGTVHSIDERTKLISVSDGDGEVWECEPSELSVNTDAIMHG